MLYDWEAHSKGFNALEKTLNNILNEKGKDFARKVAKATVEEYSNASKSEFDNGVFDCARVWNREYKTWGELKQELVKEGLHETPHIDPIDADVVRWTGCSRCDSPLHPKAFRDHERYVVYGVCPKCGYYIEI